MIPSSTKHVKMMVFVVFALKTKRKILLFHATGAQKNSLVTKIQSVNIGSPMGTIRFKKYFLVQSIRPHVIKDFPSQVMSFYNFFDRDKCKLSRS